MIDINTPINEMGLYKAYKRLCTRSGGDPNRYQLTDDEKAEIIKLHHEGFSQPAIADIVNRCETSVHKVLKNADVLTGERGNRRRDITVDDVLKLKAKGLYINHIAARLGCSTHLVADRLKEAKDRGIEI